MPLDIPEATVDRAVEFAKNIVRRANQAEENIRREYIATFEHTWGIDRIGGGSKHTQLQMQEIIQALSPQIALQLLQMGQRFVKTYGNELPEQYRRPAWEYAIVDGSIVIGELLPVWRFVPPPPPVEEAETAPVQM